MKAFWAIVRRELRAVGRERTIVIAITIQLFIASFSSAILVGLLSFYDPESITLNTHASIRVGVLGDSAGPLVRSLRRRNVRVANYFSPAEAESAFQSHAIDAIIVAPQDAGTGTVEMKLFLPRSETISSVILLILREPLKQYENYLRQERGVVVRYADVTGLPSTTFEFLYSVIVPVLMFFPAFVSGSMVIDSLSEEIENHTLETLLSAPLSLNLIAGAKIVAALLLAMAQCAAWVVLLRLNQIDLSNVGLVLAFAGLIAAINTIGSAFTAVVLQDRERSQFMYSLIILIAVSASYALHASPLQVMTRLAIGDAYTGLADVAQYAVILLALLAVFFRSTKKLAAK
jgi:ABC-type Na+ efflux pump permease subunit